MGDPQWPFGPGGFDLSQFMGMFSGNASGPVNWDTARQIAAQVAAHDPATGESVPDTPVPASRAEHVDSLVRAAQTTVASATGLAECVALATRCVTRAEWTTVTLEGLHPVLEALASRTAGAFGAADFGGAALDLPSDEPDLGAFFGQMMGAVTPMFFGMQAGSLAGLLSHHALGQYDLPLPLAGSPQLAFVLSNVERFAADWELPFDELCFALGARETVHAAQRSIGWVRDRLVSLATAYVDGYELRVDRLTDDIPGFAALADLDDVDPMTMLQRLGAGDLPGLDVDPSELLAAMQTERQVPVLAELQRFGAVLGGYADTVVDSLSSLVGPNAGRIEEALRRHRVERGEAAQFVDSMLGLQLDRSHYEAGHHFCTGVVERAGLPGLNRLWERESHLPTESEFAAPGLWLARLDLGIGDD